MDAIAAYDDLLGTIYGAAERAVALEQMFRRIAAAFGGATAGAIVMARDVPRMERVVGAPAPRSASRDIKLADFDAAGMRLLCTAQFDVARRFTDVIPKSRLRAEDWFRRQADVFGLSYGMAIDLPLAGRRVRLFVARASGFNDFDAPQLRLLDRVASHFHRAFSAAPEILLEDDGHGAQASQAAMARRFGLTTAEARTAGALASGGSRQQCAAMLGISINTLKTHQKRIYAKLRVRRQGELIRAVGE